MFFFIQDLQPNFEVFAKIEIFEYFFIQDFQPNLEVFAKIEIFIFKRISSQKRASLARTVPKPKGLSFFFFPVGTLQVPTYLPGENFPVFFFSRAGKKKTKPFQLKKSVLNFLKVFCVFVNWSPGKAITPRRFSIQYHQYETIYPSSVPLILVILRQ